MIILSEYESAALLADMAFGTETKLRFPDRVKMIFDHSESGVIRVKEVIQSYKTEEEWLVAQKEYQTKRLKYMYKWLLDNYSDTNYAERFIESDAQGRGSYWVNECGIDIDEIKNEII